MSYILDALRKIEQEKNKKRPDGRVSITGDLFRERSRPAPKFGTWKVSILITLSVFITAAGTWFVLRGNSTKSAPVIRPETIVQAVPVVLPPVQSQASPVIAPPVSTPATVPVTAVKVPVAPADVKLVRERRRAQKLLKPQQSPQKQTIPTVVAPADIKLSGIAWQDERAARRVVINGFLLKEGAIVSGARITDIYADRVRFATSAGQFEIKLDAVLPAEVKK